MKIIAGFVILCCVFGIVGCSTIKVRTDYDPEVNFAKYKTFDWLPQRKIKSGKPHVRSLMDKRIQTAIEAELISRGYEKRGVGEPDFFFAFHAGAKDKVDVSHYGYRYGPRGRWWGERVSVHRYKEGTLILDFIDREKKELVWRGWATSVLGGPEKAEEEIRDIVTKVLEEFPPE